jgi:hypothetical protein
MMETAGSPDIFQANVVANGILRECMELTLMTSSASLEAVLRTN